MITITQLTSPFLNLDSTCTVKSYIVRQTWTQRVITVMLLIALSYRGFSPSWRHSASQQSTGTEVYPERRQGKLWIIAVFQVVPIGQIEKNIWNIIDFQKLLKTRERNARDYLSKGGACG